MTTTLTKEIAARLEYLRQELRAERISYGELAELQGLAPYIAPGDTELLEAAGVPEHTTAPRNTCKHGYKPNQCAECNYNNQ